MTPDARENERDINRWTVEVHDNFSSCANILLLLSALMAINNIFISYNRFSCCSHSSGSITSSTTVRVPVITSLETVL